MPCNYKKICKDNIGRRGDEFDDIGRLISELLYSDRSHFVYELLQNAEDALERRFRQHPNNSAHCEIQFRLFHNRLEFRHFGSLFNEEDVKGISDVLKGTKQEDVTQIGKFGIGFKSVYAFTASPEIHSGDEHFVIKRYIRPEEKDPTPDLSIARDETVFVFPFDHKDLSPKQAFNLISNKLRRLGPRVLLFLRQIDEIEWSIEPDREKGQYLKEARKANSCKTVHRATVIGQKNGQDEEEHWLIFEKPVAVPYDSEKVPVEVGFRLEISAKDKTKSIARINSAPLVVYFQTEKETRLGFLTQGPYRTTTARDNILKDDGWNKKLIEETAELVVESLRQLKEMGLLSVSLLEALPIRVDDFPKDSMFYPIFSRVHKALTNEALLPADDGTFIVAINAKLIRGTALMEILNQEQLGALFQPNNAIKWMSTKITQDRTPDLRSYLMQELDIEEVTPESFSSKITESFLKSRTDEWFVKFYEFLSEQKALWKKPWSTLRAKPILRLQDGTHVNPFRPDGSPNAYLAVGTDTDTSLPIVKVELSQHKEAHRFLSDLGISELDIVAEVTEKILPKYKDDSVTVGSEENKRDLQKIERAYKTDSHEKKDRLRNALLKTPFILAEWPTAEDTVYRTPDQIYFGTDELCMYFYGNDSFACVSLDHPQSVLFKDLGVKETVRVHRKKSDLQGYVSIMNYHGWHKRGLDRFDPCAKVDGLKHAIAIPIPEKSSFIWNNIAIPNSDCIRGVVEESTRKTYEGSSKENQLSIFGKLLTDNAWLPDSNGNIHKPSDLALDDLLESFISDEKLADQLSMKRDVFAKLAEEYGISRTDLDRARRIGESPPEIQQQIDSLLKKQKMSQENQEIDPYHEALSEAFSVSGCAMNDRRSGGGSTQDPSRRREKTREEIATAIENEDELGERFSFTLLKKWKGKNDQVRVALAEWYGGRCQICGKTFIQRSGEPYFEGLYLVSRTTAEWRDREGNVLCLCAWHKRNVPVWPERSR